MTDRDNHDHGDAPITLEEIETSHKEHPINVRIRGKNLTSARVRWNPENDAPHPRKVKSLIDLTGWIEEDDDGSA